MYATDLTHLSLFTDLSQEQFALVEPLFQLCDYSTDTVVYEQGDPAQHLYVVADGEVVVRYKPYDGPAIVVSRVGPGEVFGWSAALGRETYSSGAACARRARLYRISGKALSRLCEQYPETGNLVLERLAALIVEGLQAPHAQVLNMLMHSVDILGDCTEEKPNGIQ